MSINEIFEELKAESGKNAKLDILKREKNNKTLRRVIEAALNPFKMYYIKKIPDYAVDGGVFGSDDKKDLDWALNEIVKLSTRKVTGKAAQAFLVNLLESLSADDAKVLERVILKDLDCGVATSPNKVWPGLIPTFAVMLCSPFDMKLINKLHWPAIVETKMDGMRFSAVVKDGKVTVFSRKGQVLDIFGAIDEPFLKIANGESWVFDGELLVYDKQRKYILPRKEGNGILNKAIKGTIGQEEAKRITFQCWDMIPYEAWNEGFYDKPYDERSQGRYEAFRNAGYKGNSVGHYVVDGLEGAQAIFEEHLARGQEGVIVKDRLAPWENARSKWQIKMKGERNADLLCYGWAEGTKKNKGKLGALRLQTADGKLKVDCGTGLSDEQRKRLKKKDVVGKIIAIRYNEKIQTEKGDWSLFLPVFLEIRADKDEANTFDELE